jgi:hypothetical protein
MQKPSKKSSLCKKIEVAPLHNHAAAVDRSFDAATEQPVAALWFPRQLQYKKIAAIPAISPLQKIILKGFAMQIIYSTIWNF